MRGTAKLAGFLALAAVAAVQYGPALLRRAPTAGDDGERGAELPAVQAGSGMVSSREALSASPFVPYTDARLQDTEAELSERTPGSALIAAGTATFLLYGAGVYAKTDGAPEKWRLAYGFPLPGRSLFAKYRPGEDLETFDVSVGTVVARGGRVWAGYKFYSGEGCDGLGGLAYYEPATGAAGVLRHPALLRCGIDGIYADGTRLAARTYRQGEYVTYVCSGVVELDLKTLTAWSYLPRESDVVQDHDPAPGEKILGDKYYVPLEKVLAGDPAFEKKEAPGWTDAERAKILAEGLDSFMRRTAGEEASAQK